MFAVCVYMFAVFKLMFMAHKLNFCAKIIKILQYIEDKIPFILFFCSFGKLLRTRKGIENYCERKSLEDSGKSITFAL